MEQVNDLEDVWNNQYKNNFETALKDKNLFQLETAAILKHVDVHVAARNEKSELRILELGCGSGDFAHKLQKVFQCSPIKIQITCVDFSSQAIKNANSKCIPNTRFIRDDFISFLSSMEPDYFDVIITQRAIMALLDKSEQIKFYSLTNNVLSQNGVGIFSECFENEFGKFNKLRHNFGLEPIKKIWHSRHLDEQELEQYFTNVTYDHFCSTYMMVTRLVYPSLAEPKHNQTIHDRAFGLDNCGETSFLKIALVKK